MANYMTIQKLVNFLPKCEGASAKMRLSGKQLTQMIDKGAQTEPELAEALRIQLGRAKNPVLEIGAKAKSNYSIAGYRLLDGKKVLGQGAVSLSNVGTNQSVVKVHGMVGRDILGANRPLLGTSNGLAEGQSGLMTGFLDCGKPTNVKDIAAAITRQNGKLTATGHVGQNFGVTAIVRENDIINGLRSMPLSKFERAQLEGTLAKLEQAGIKDGSIGFMRTADKTTATINAEGIGHINIDVNEGNLVNAAKIWGVDPKYLERYAKGSKDLQRKIDALMTDVRQALRGEPKGPAPATAETFAKVAEPIKPFEIPKVKEIAPNSTIWDEKIAEVGKKYDELISKSTDYNEQMELITRKGVEQRQLIRDKFNARVEEIMKKYRSK